MNLLNGMGVVAYMFKPLLLKTALASNEALARAVRFQSGALRHDVVIPLYDLSVLPTGAREEPSGVE